MSEIGNCLFVQCFYNGTKYTRMITREVPIPPSKYEMVHFADIVLC